jgi:hypothetical protein
MISATSFFSWNITFREAWGGSVSVVLVSAEWVMNTRGFSGLEIALTLYEPFSSETEGELWTLRWFRENMIAAVHDQFVETGNVLNVVVHLQTDAIYKLRPLPTSQCPARYHWLGRMSLQTNHRFDEDASEPIRRTRRKKSSISIRGTWPQHGSKARLRLWFIQITGTLALFLFSLDLWMQVDEVC